MRNSERERAWERRIQRVGEWVEALAAGRGTKGLPEGQLTGVTIRLPSEDKPETLVVIRAQVDGTGYVAFCGALELSDALLTWRAKDGAAGLKWRLDIPWEERVR